MKRLSYYVVSLAVFLAPTAHAQSAKDILKASGVKGGLVVHLGCGDPGAPGLTAALIWVGRVRSCSHNLRPRICLGGLESRCASSQPHTSACPPRPSRLPIAANVIIPIDNREPRGRGHLLSVPPRGSVQQRFIHHSCATTDKTLYVRRAWWYRKEHSYFWWWHLALLLSLLSITGIHGGSISLVRKNHRRKNHR